MRSIESLPIETLAEIFVLVCTGHLCPVSTSYITTQPSFMNYPVIISHVCSSWRRLALTSSSLWTHIDIVPSRFSVNRLPISTETYLARAGKKPLGIHIVSSDLDPIPDSRAKSHLLQCLVTLAPRAWGVTVEMASHGHPTAQVHLLQAISVLLKGCVAGKLTHFFIELATNGRPYNGLSTLLRQPQALVEALWHPVTALRLRDFYPIWTSKAYRGLTELRMSGHYVSIPDSSLVAMLKSSPMLRILHISMRIGITPSQVSTAPVLLKDLEVFGPNDSEVSPYGTLHHRALLRLVQPGPKPLTLLIRNLSRHNNDNQGAGTYGLIKGFLNRSNVTRLVVNGSIDYAELADLLALTSTVQVLALERLKRVSVVDNESHLPVPSSLKELCVINSTNPSPSLDNSPTWPLIEQVIRRHSVPELKLWRYSLNDGSIPNNLYTVCPHVTMIPDNYPDPIEALR